MDVGWVGRVGVLADYREIPADLGDTGFSIVKLRERVSQACFMLGQSHNFGVCIGSMERSVNINIVKIYLPVFTTLTFPSAPSL